MEKNTRLRKQWQQLLSLIEKVEVMNPNNNQNEIGRQKAPTDGVRKQQIDLEDIGIFGNP